MINWEELKHIHVIRKLEEILAQWFHTDIFFVDERGQVRNFDLLDRHKEFKNPLAAALMPKEKGREAMMKCIAEANEKVYKGEHAHVAVHGPVGCENGLRFAHLDRQRIFGKRLRLLLRGQSHQR